MHIVSRSKRILRASIVPVGHDETGVLRRRSPRGSPHGGRILPDQTVLDVGAGTGFLTEAASRKARKVIALDFSESMISEARTKLVGRNVEFRIGSAEQIPLPDASVDAVIGNMVLHHCPSPETAVKEMTMRFKESTLSPASIISQSLLSTFSRAESTLVSWPFASGD